MSNTKVYVPLKVNEPVNEWLLAKARRMTKELGIKVSRNALANMLFEKAMKEEKR